MSSKYLAPIAPQCKASAQTELFMKEKKMSLSGDSASIKDGSGAVVFKIDAKMISLSQRRTLLDAGGKAVGQVRKKRTPGLHPTCYVGTMQDEKTCSVKSKGTLNITKCDADIRLGDKVIGEVSGNWRAKSFSIRIDGAEVATVSRKTSASSLVMGADTYCIAIQPGVDTAFMCLVTIALDELYHDE